MNENAINYIYDEEKGFYTPCLTPPESPKIGKYGRLRLHYLKEHHKGLYTGWLISGKLNTHLEEIDHQAEVMMESLIAQIQAVENVTEDLKATDPMVWAQCMNNIQARAEEVVREELIFV